MRGTSTGKRTFAMAAGLVLSLLVAGIAPTQAQEPDYEFADVLAPYYDAAPQEDILDLKLGMNVDQVLLTLAHNDFEVKGNSLGRTALGRGAMRYLKAEREHEGTRPAYERITVYFDFSENPRALAIYRESSYRRGHYPNYTTVMDALLQKYGDAPVYDTNRGEVMGAWFPKKLPRKCGPMRNNFRYFRAPQNIEQHEVATGALWSRLVSSAASPAVRSNIPAASCSIRASSTRTTRKPGGSPANRRSSASVSGRTSSAITPQRSSDRARLKRARKTPARWVAGRGSVRAAAKGWREGKIVTRASLPCCRGRRAGGCLP